MSYPFSRDCATRTAGTEAAYRKNLFAKEVILIWAAHSHAAGASLVEQEVVRLFKAYAQERGRSARKQAISAALYVLEAAGWASVRYTLAAQLWAANREFKNKRSRGKPRTSAKKQKWVARDQSEKLFACLRQRPSWGRVRGINLMSIAKKTGGRPKELPGIQAEYRGDGALIVVIPNAKNSNGRSHGPERTLIFHPEVYGSEWIDDLWREIQDLQSQLSDAADPELEWRRIYGAARKAILAANKKLWANARLYVALYSFRHQFAADAKAVDLSRVTLAALMGHGSDSTADRSYAPRSKGRAGSVLPSANPAEESRVRASYDKGKLGRFLKSRAARPSQAPEVKLSPGAPGPRM